MDHKGEALMATQDLGTNMALSAARSVDLARPEVEALRRAALHVFGQALRWAADQVALSPDDDSDPDLDQCAITFRAFNSAAKLIDDLGWEARSSVTLRPDAYVRGVVVLAMEFHKHEAPILRVGQYDTLMWLSGHMDDAGWPQLTEDEAWSVVFEGGGEQ
jgi:hypothetical protein